MSAEDLTAFQIEVARVFFELEAAKGFAVAGGAALVASDLIDRPTLDLDLFTHAPATSITDARDQLLRAIEDRGWSASIIHGGDAFSRLVVEGDGSEVLVDLAIDSPPIAQPTVTVLGPTLAPRELAVRKLLALFGRAEARDFADVFVLSGVFGRDVLLADAVRSDPGFDPVVLAQMMATLDRFADDDIPAPDETLPALRAFFREWVGDLRSSE